MHCGGEVEYPTLCEKCGPVCRDGDCAPCPHKANKYGARKVKIDGHIFPSAKEASRYLVLRDMQQYNEICELRLQPSFVLQEGFRDRTGKKYAPIRYIADFEYYLPDGTGPIIEDAKGKKTDVFALKEKMFRYKYPDIDFRIV